MKRSARLGPPYSIFFISDTKLEGDIEAGGRPIEWSDAYVSVGCAYCYEKESSVTIGLFGEVALEGDAVFDGEIKTPSRQVVVSTAHDEVVLSHEAPTALTRIRIWTNDPIEPDDIVIAVG